MTYEFYLNTNLNITLSIKIYGFLHLLVILLNEYSCGKFLNLFNIQM